MAHLKTFVVKQLEFSHLIAFVVVHGQCCLFVGSFVEITAFFGQVKTMIHVFMLLGGGSLNYVKRLCTATILL